MNRNEVFELIVNHSRSVLPNLLEHEFQRSDRLTELGANSVERADIIMLTMDSLCLQIPRVELYGARNIGELADLVHEKLPKV